MSKTLYKIHMFRTLSQLLDNLHSFQIYREYFQNLSTCQAIKGISNNIKALIKHMDSIV